MKKSVQLATAAVAVLIVGLLTGVGLGANGARRAERGEKGAAGKPELYSVVKIGDEVQIVKQSDVAGLRKSTAEEDKKAKKDYDEAKKAAAKSKDKSDLGKPPVRRRVIELKKGLKTEDDAKDWLDKHPQGQGGGAKKKTAAP
jgi:hypothetical protein